MVSILDYACITETHTHTHPHARIGTLVVFQRRCVKILPKCVIIADNMRSDPGDHSEQVEQGRFPTRTRRMSKGSCLLDDGEVAKSSAEHSLSHGVPKLTAVQPAKGRQTAVRLPDSTENHLSYDNIQIAKEDTPEMRQLKELMLSHLDLIQQQQELLSSKDRQIQSLKSERDTVRAGTACMWIKCSNIQHLLWVFPWVVILHVVRNH